jgi:DNA polymerase I
VLADPTLEAYAHHGKYDLAVLKRHGYEVGNLAFDTMIAGYLLSQTSLRLKDMAFTRLGIEMTEITELIGTGRAQMTMDKVDSELAGQYAAGDVEATFELTEQLKPEIEANNLTGLLTDIELPLVPVLIELEEVGISVDLPYLTEFSTEITDRIAELESEIHAVAGREFNINSTRQMATLLFEELKLPSGRRTKTGYSVDVDVLEKVRDQHPIVDLVLEFRQLGKLKSTYVDALMAQVNPETGRVHTSFNQTVAATGRLSSTNPNLQNIPIRTEQGRRVRRAFVADPRPEYRLFDDPVLLAADYSQIELRLLAHLSDEPFLVDAFNSQTDIHRATASIVYGISPADVTGEMRRVAKAVNFGILYGMQAFGLSRDTGLPRAEAQKFIDEYWARLPRVRTYFDEVLRFGAAHGYVRSESGRRRFLPDLTSSNGQRRLAAERMAMNMPIQGGAADIMKIAMNHMSSALKESDLKAKVLLQVHDELVLEVDRSHLEPAAALVRKTMQEAVTLKVPVVAEVGYGLNWDDMTELPV